MLVVFLMHLQFSRQLLAFFICETIVTWFIARHKATRFVFNVISADVDLKKPKDE